MKILHINTNYLNNALHQNMIKALSEKGTDNSVFVPTCHYSASVIVPAENVTVSECFRKIDRVNYYSKQKKIFSSITKTYDIKSFDCIHAYTVFTDGNVAYTLNREYGIPYVVAVRNTDINTFFKFMPHLRKRGAEILKNASAVFFLSSAYKERLFSKYISYADVGEIESKTHIVPNGVDEFWIDNILDTCRNSPGNEIKICFAGKIDKNKNCVLTAKACEKLIESGFDVSYTVIGQLIDNNFKKLIDTKEYIHHIPFLSKEELIYKYRENDIFVMPSYTETFGMVYVEAMSQGLPVVYTKNEGFDNQFEEGIVGYHVSNENAEDIVLTVKKIIDNYCDISRNCIQNVARFDWNEISRRYIDVYSSILE